MGTIGKIKNKNYKKIVGTKHDRTARGGVSMRTQVTCAIVRDPLPPRARAARPAGRGVPAVRRGGCATDAG